jgi:hypothetical protein
VTSIYIIIQEKYNNANLLTSMTHPERNVSRSLAPSSDLIAEHLWGIVRGFSAGDDPFPGGLPVTEASLRAEPDAELERVEEFARDPFSFLFKESQALFDVFKDPELADADKAQRLDTYFEMIEALDREAFLVTKAVQSGVPDGYVPHGFTDMGEVQSTVPANRYGRAMNQVDTASTLRRHRTVLEFLFTNMHPENFTGPEGKLRYALTIMSNIARQISMNMPHGEPTQAERGGLLPVSTVDASRCQQHALTTQVLLQAFGLRSRLSKNTVATQEEMDMYGEDFYGWDHVSNVVTVEGPEGERVYMLDTTNPYPGDDGTWKPGIFRLENQRPDGSWMVAAGSSGRRKYRERDRMYWMIQRDGE